MTLTRVTFSLVMAAIVGFTHPAFANTYAELSADDKAYVDTQCLPVQFQEGATAFRECVTQQTTLLSASGTATQSRLSFDEQFAVQQSCRDSGEPGTQSYQACAAAQTDSLQGTPESDISQVTDDETYAIQQSCYSAQTTQGVLAYRECVNSALAGLENIARPDLSALSLIDKNALQLRCSADNFDAASYRNCLLDAVGGAAVSAAAAQPANDSAQSQTTSAGPEVEPEAIDNVAVVAATPETVPTETLAEVVTPPADTATPAGIDDTTTSTLLPADGTDRPSANTPLLPDAQATDQSGNDKEELAPATSVVAGGTEADEGSLLDRATDIGARIKAQLQSSADGLSGINKLVMLAALALPLCLIGFWLLMRGRTSAEPEYQAAPYPNPLIERVGPSHQRRERQNADPEFTTQRDQLAETDTQDFAQQVDELFSDETAAREQPTRLVDPQELDAPAPTTSLDGRIPPDRGPIATWLDQHNPEQQLSLAVEFMIYWMAYADERYHPDLKQKIFALTDPDEHDLIKRWVLKQDVHAFASITRWLQTTATVSQREQILSLLMTLLVSENALTPSQNTLLRFLGDAFGSGNVRLDALYREAYGHAMPALPRVDKTKWWDHQSTDALKRWDARSVSRQSEEIQARVKLGLPLTGDLDPQQILDHYQRAAARCNTDRFSDLTERERILVDGQLTVFEQARTSLMEAFA